MDPIKAEKQSAMRRYHRMRKIGRTIRSLEVCAAMMIILWTSPRLPAAARVSGDVLRAAASAILSPRFVFLIGNAIVLVLFVKSGNVGGSPPAGSDLRDEYLETRGSRIFYAPPAAVEDVVYEEKKVCVETKRKEIQRTTSEKMERKREEPELRRSETDVGRKADKEEDADEFRRMIEDYIAKQWRFHREESMALVSTIEHE
ncbi:hypothetical protein J5N97_019608 [Dioscorea zingiberensis]|uniref:DUF4408 domain-containing protein n=1 Tax=Dioscorea zingiberensis TaxID=325984 RepID=A0A9D5CEX2_9LILI|nr:hypothetical protein J5N97_019608 [Dioscorea zingiberensis]